MDKWQSDPFEAQRASETSYLMTKGGRQRGQWKAGFITCIFTLRDKRSKKASGKRALLESNYMAENIIAFLCLVAFSVFRSFFFLRTAQCSSQGELWQLYLLLFLCKQAWN